MKNAITVKDQELIDYFDSEIGKPIPDIDMENIE